MTLIDADKTTLNQAAVLKRGIRFINEFRKLDSRLELQTTMAFLGVCVLSQEGDVCVGDIADFLGVTSGAGSRNVRALTERGARGREGLGLIETREDPNYLSRKTLHFTKKGAMVRDSLVDIIAGD